MVNRFVTQFILISNYIYIGNETHTRTHTHKPKRMNVVMEESRIEILGHSRTWHNWKLSSVLVTRTNFGFRLTENSCNRHKWGGLRRERRGTERRKSKRMVRYHGISKVCMCVCEYVVCVCVCGDGKAPRPLLFDRFRLMLAFNVDRV